MVISTTTRKCLAGKKSRRSSLSNQWYYNFRCKGKKMTTTTKTKIESNRTEVKEKKNLFSCNSKTSNFFTIDHYHYVCSMMMMTTTDERTNEWIGQTKSDHHQTWTSLARLFFLVSKIILCVFVMCMEAKDASLFVIMIINAKQAEIYLFLRCNKKNHFKI